MTYAKGRFADESGRRQDRFDGEIALRLLKQRTVMLAGEINRVSAQRATSQLLLLSEEAPNEPIKLFINSPGGDADAAFAIFDVVRLIESPVNVVATGLAASAAVIVLLASPKERRFSLPNARFLIHQPSTGVRGDASDIQIEASEILKCRDRISKLIAEQTGKKPKQVDGDTRRNFWMSAEEASEYGLVGKVISGAKNL